MCLLYGIVNNDVALFDAWWFNYIDNVEDWEFILFVKFYFILSITLLQMRHYIVCLFLMISIRKAFLTLPTKLKCTIDGNVLPLIHKALNYIMFGNVQCFPYTLMFEGFLKGPLNAMLKLNVAFCIKITFHYFQNIHFYEY
jgi:hypothetical protein